MVRTAQRASQHRLRFRCFLCRRKYLRSSPSLAQIPTWYPSLRPRPLPVLNRLSRHGGVCEHCGCGPQQTKTRILEAATLKFASQAHAALKMQTAPEIPRPSREPINRYPVKVTLIIDTTQPQIKLPKEGSHPVLRPPLVPERHFLKEGGPGDSPPHTDLDGVLCCHTPQAHEAKLTRVRLRLRRLACLY